MRLWSLVLGAVAASASACALNQKGVDPPADTFFYPASAVADPSSSWLFVTNSNADLRYNDGTLVVVDLVSAQSDRSQGAGQVPASGGPVLGSTGPTQSWDLCPQEDYVNPLPRSDPQICCWDRLDANILDCDERRYVQTSSTVRIGSFAAGMVWQPYCPDACNPGCMPDDKLGRLLIGVRGDTSLTWADVRNLPGTPTFACGQGDAPLGECSDRLLETTSALVTETMDTSAPVVPVPDEPYALALDQARGFLYVGHLVGSTATVDTGGVSLFDISNTSLSIKPQPPKYLSPFPSPFPPNGAGFYGITALKLHPPLGQPFGSPNEVFASSRDVPLVTSIGSFGPSVCSGAAEDIVVEGAGDSLSSGLVGSEMRGVEFIDSPSGPAQRAYALQRVPPDLVGFSIVTNQAGGTSAIPTDVSETCSSPTFLYQYPPENLLQPPDPAAMPRLLVNCFDTGEIYVFDPAGPTLLTTLQVGRGPAGIVFDSVRPVAYIIGFSDNNISVLDLDPQSQTQYHVIQRLGFPSVMPR